MPLNTTFLPAAPGCSQKPNGNDVQQLLQQLETACWRYTQPLDQLDSRVHSLGRANWTHVCTAWGGHGVHLKTF